MTLRVRDMTPKDAPMIIDLGRFFYEEAGFAQQCDYEEDICADYINQMCSSDNACAFVLEDDGVPIGFFFGTVSPYIFSRQMQALEQLWFVMPGYRQNGAGTALLEAFEAWAKQKDVHYMAVGCFGGAAAEAYLEKRGYDHEGTTYKRRIV